MKYILAITIIISNLIADINTERFASFSLNNGDLQIENGYYLEAVDSYRSAFEASSSDEIKSKAILKEANLFSLYLDDKFVAIDLYKKLLKNYQNVSSMEYAIYSLGMLYKGIGDKQKAISTFQKYNKYYKGGKFSNQVEFMIRRLQKKEYIKPVKSNLLIDSSNKIPKVRVLLLRKNYITISSKSEIIVDKDRYKNVKIKYKNGKIYINNKIYFKPELTSKTPMYVKEKNRTYKGTMLLDINKNKLALINKLDMNDYLYGVVTSESYDKWNIEALKAQAVASRTFAYYHSKVRDGWIYDIKDNTSDQVYKGINGETPKSIKAVNDTFGKMLISNDKVILAQYTSSNGWYSASSNEIFNVNKPYLKAHKDNFSKAMPNGKWVVKISIKEFEKNLNKLGFDFKGISKLEPIQIGESGRVLKMRVIAKNGEKILKTYSTIRKAANLKDILFKVKKVGDYFVFDGGGYGHGVGYSQWGSQKMAKDGYRYDDILEFYYNNSITKKLW